jgi:hypothetical protein
MPLDYHDQYTIWAGSQSEILLLLCTLSHNSNSSPARRRSKWPSRPQFLKFIDASCAWNSVPRKFKTTLSPTLSSGTMFHIQSIQKNTLLSSILNHTDTYNNNQDLTQSRRPLHCSVNSFSSSCCKSLRHVSTSSRRAVGVACYYIKNPLYSR